MDKITYGFYWDDEATKVIEKYYDKLPIVKYSKFETTEYIPFQENEIIHFQIDKFSGVSIEVAIKKIRKFVQFSDNNYKNSEHANLSINIMLCFTENYNKENIENFLEENSKLYAMKQSQRDLFTQNTTNQNKPQN